MEYSLSGNSKGRAGRSKARQGLAISAFWTPPHTPYPGSPAHRMCWMNTSEWMHLWVGICMSKQKAHRSRKDLGRRTPPQPKFTFSPPLRLQKYNQWFSTRERAWQPGCGFLSFHAPLRNGGEKAYALPWITYNSPISRIWIVSSSLPPPPYLQYSQ